ncbi:hypothetical protein M3Y98_00861700 [Aphelenchoides besseyi]|nr:hypothetical protein M3Y98_00861700 [Aphelenchoides besseyi]KAI6211185.1 hypothetical protein M3Y96_00407000 [Aphelenchoides besseyi]
MAFDKHFCLCGVHVDRATRWIAILFICLQVMSIINWSMQLKNDSGYRREQSGPVRAFYRYGARGQISAQTGGADSVLYSAIALIFTTMVHVVLLYGNVKGKAICYLPFIVLNSIGVILAFVISLMLVVFGGASAMFVDEVVNLPIESKNEQAMRQVLPMIEVGGHAMTVFLFMAAGAIFLATIIQAYLLSVVFRGYRYLRESSTPKFYGKLMEEETESEVYVHRPTIVKFAELEQK